MSRATRPTEIMQQSGLRLLAVRDALGWHQERFAQEIGVERTTLANWEGGKRMPDVLAMVRLYQRFDIPLEWIYAGELGRLPYDIADKLRDRAAELGAVVGAPGCGMADAGRRARRPLLSRGTGSRSSRPALIEGAA